MKKNINDISYDIVEIFENMLEKKNIIIPDKDRIGEKNEATIYGLTYINLVNEIKEYLIKQNIKEIEY